MSSQRRVRPRMASWRLAALGGAAAVLSGCTRVSNLGLLEPASQQGEAVANLYRVFFWAAAAIALIVYGLIAWSVVRYRHRSNELPDQQQYHVVLEVFYTVVPLLIVVGLFVGTTRVQGDVGDVSPNPDVRVEATAFQWDWRFTYPDDGIVVSGSPEQTAELVVPSGSTVQLTVTSEDVIHSFWVPELLFKRDVFPGNVRNEFQVTIEVDKEGAYVGRCAELCGTYHSTMSFELRAVSPDRYQQYLSALQSGMSQPDALSSIGEEPFAVTTKPFATDRASG